MIPLLRRAAIDTPGHRSSHLIPTPRGGGLPIAAGLLIASALIHTSAVLAFAAGVGVFALIGFADDLRSLPAGRRLLLQAGAGSVVAGLLVANLAQSPVALAALAALGMVWVTGFVNAFNFMDGVNGIAGTHALLAGLAYVVLGLWLPDGFLTAAGAAVAAGAFAFLPWNAGRARVFLGDVGSYGLGAALSVLAAYAFLHGVPLEAAAAPLTLYLADTSWTLLRRLRRGERLSQAHRTHIYQQWCDLGWSHQRVTATASACTVLLIMLGSASLVGSATLRVAADLAGAGVLAVYLASPTLLRRQPQPEAG